MRPDHVTLTGVDDFTDLGELQALSRAFPVEWGILLHREKQGEGRYPSLDRIEAVLALGMRCAAHLCGAHARAAVRGEPLPPEINRILDSVGRIQVNTSERNIDYGRIEKLAARRGARAILQCRGEERFPSEPRVDWLFDRSGGRGLRATRWPVPADGTSFVGFAGGLGPETIAGPIDAIAAVLPPGTRYWLDMEGAIRTDDRFDPLKCRSVLEAVYGAAHG